MPYCGNFRRKRPNHIKTAVESVSPRRGFYSTVRVRLSQSGALDGAIMASVRAKSRPDGTPYFQAVVRVKGHPPQFAAFDRRTDAKRWGEQTEAAIRQHRYFGIFEA